MPSLLGPRDPFTEAKNTLSSWDNCMAKSYCKWPVIVAIVVGSLIVLSIVLCVARCICCGAEVACCCFKCCTCCCPSGRSSKHKRIKSDNFTPSPYPPPLPPAPVDARPLNQQYRSHATPAFHPAPSPAPAPVRPEEPQYARFESPTKTASDDALPAMPSWSDAKVSHVEEVVYPEKLNNIEMDRLDQNGSVAGSSVGAAALAGASRRSPGPRRSPAPGRSPVDRPEPQDAYGFPAGYHDAFAGSAPPRDNRNSPAPQGRFHGQEQGVHRGMSPVQPTSPVYGVGPGYAQPQQYDRRSPGPNYASAQQHDRRSPGPNYAQHQDFERRSPRPNYAQQPFPQPSPPRGPSPADAYGYSDPSPDHGMHRNESYAPTESTQYEPSAAPSYPGQQTYAAEPAYPGQQAYQAFSPANTQGQQYSGVTRKAAPGSWKDI